jgi:hypothetical protein
MMARNAATPMAVDPARRAAMTDDTHNETQPSPNLSTEHQKEGDARSPSDTLDRGQ